MGGADVLRSIEYRGFVSHPDVGNRFVQTNRQMNNNGFSTGEEDSRGPTDQICCLIDDSERCRNAAGNASYSKRIAKTVTTRRLKLMKDPSVSAYILGCSVTLFVTISLTLYWFVFVFSVVTPLHMRLSQGSHPMCTNEATPKGFGGRQQ